MRKDKIAREKRVDSQRGKASESVRKDKIAREKRVDSQRRKARESERTGESQRGKARVRVNQYIRSLKGVGLFKAQRKWWTFVHGM